MSVFVKRPLRASLKVPSLKRDRANEAMHRAQKNAASRQAALLAQSQNLNPYQAQANALSLGNSVFGNIFGFVR